MIDDKPTQFGTKWSKLDARLCESPWIIARKDKRDDPANLQFTNDGKVVLQFTGFVKSFDALGQTRIGAATLEYKGTWKLERRTLTKEENVLEREWAREREIEFGRYIPPEFLTSPISDEITSHVLEMDFVGNELPFLSRADTTANGKFVLERLTEL